MNTNKHDTSFYIGVIHGNIAVQLHTLAEAYRAGAARRGVQDGFRRVGAWAEHLKRSVVMSPSTVDVLCDHFQLSRDEFYSLCEEAIREHPFPLPGSLQLVLSPRLPAAETVIDGGFRITVQQIPAT